MPPKDRDSRREMFVSVAIAVAVTLIFIGQTALEWTHPVHLSSFHLQYDNPFNGFLR